MYEYMYLCLASRALISWSSTQIVIYTYYLLFYSEVMD